MSDVRDQLRSDLTQAMRARDRLRVSVLRTALAAIANAEAQVVPDDRSAIPTTTGPIAGASVGVGSSDVERRLMTEDDRQAILAGEVAERLTAADVMDGAGASADARRLRDEAALLQGYLTP